VTPANSEVDVSIGIGLPHVSIGINLPFYPEFVPVPGYPVYYAPRIHANYFFYDGLYWVYQDDDWYASYWYNGPWWFVGQDDVPLFILRIPVFYYMQPPFYFRGWHLRRPPHWGDHWGREWEHRHRDWDRWERGSAPPPAPLPLYQRQYSGDRYPRVEEQQRLRERHYRYQPRDRAVREHLKSQGEYKSSTPVRQRRYEEPPMREQRPPDSRYSRPVEENRRVAPGLPPRREGETMRREAPASSPQRGPAVQEQRQQPRGAQREHEQVAPKPRGQEQGSQDRGVKIPQKQAPAPSQNREQVLRDRRRPPEQVTPRSRGQEQKSWKGEDWQAPKRDRGKEHEREQD